MKSQIRLGLCLALGLSLYACSSEGEPIGPKTPPAPEERPAFTLDLEAEGALSELRGDFSMDFKVGPKGALKVNIEKDHTYTARCFLRQEGQEKCYYGSVTFTGQENGKLKVKRGANSEVDFYIQDNGKTGTEGEKKYGFEKGQKWYLLVVFGGEHLGSSGTDKTRIRFCSVNESIGQKALRRVKEGDKVTLSDIPYVSDWVPIDVAVEGGTKIGVGQARTPLTFKPLGTLLRIRAKNNLAHAPVQLRRLGFSLSNNATYSLIFSLKDGKGADKPTYTPENSETKISAALEAGEELQAGHEDTGYYLLWLYPGQGTGSTFQVTSWSIADVATESPSLGSTSALMPSNAEAKQLKQGSSYWTTASIDPPQMILGLLDEYNYVGEGSPKLATNHSNKGRQMFTYASAQAIVANRPGYHIPTQDEWQMIIGLADARLPKGSGLAISSKDEVLPGQLYIDVNQGSTSSDYYPGTLDGHGETNIFYGVRFRGHNKNHSTSRYFSAWRYEVIQNPQDHTGFLYRIRSRYLGPSSTLKIADIAKESWWNTSDPTEVVRYLPFAGGYFAGVWDEPNSKYLIPKQENIHDPYQVGHWGTYWSSTPIPSGSSLRAAGITQYVLAGAKYYPDYRDWFNKGSSKQKPEGYNHYTLNPAFSGNLGSIPADKHASVRLIRNY